MKTLKPFLLLLFVGISFLSSAQRVKIRDLFAQTDSLLQLKDYKGALVILNTIIDADPSSEDGFNYRAFVYSKLQMYREAAADMRILVNRFPSNVGYNINAGWYFLLSKKYNTAKEYSLAAIKLQPENYSAYLNAGHACLVLGQDEQANYYYICAVSYLPNEGALNRGPMADFALLDSMGIAPKNTGRKMFSSLFELLKENAAANTVLDSIYTEVVLNNKKGNDETVLALKERFIDKELNYQEKRWHVLRDFMWDVGKAYYQKMNITIAQGKFLQYVEQINETIGDSSKQLMFQKDMATFLLSINDNLGSLGYGNKLYKTVIRFHFKEELLNAYMLIGDAYKELAFGRESIFEITPAQRRAYNFADSAKTYFLKAYEHAEALKDNEGLYIASNRLYNLYASSEQFSKFEEYYQNCLRLQPKTKHSLYPLKMDYIRTLSNFSKKPEAIKAGWDCIATATTEKKGGKDFSELYYIIGKNHVELGNGDSALWYFQKSIAFYDAHMATQDYSKTFISPLTENSYAYGKAQRLLMQKGKSNEWLALAEKIKSATLYRVLTGEDYLKKAPLLADEQKKLSPDEAIISFSSYATIPDASALGFSNSTVVTAVPTQQTWKQIVDDAKAGTITANAITKMLTLIKKNEKSIAMEVQPVLVAGYHVLSMGKFNLPFARSTISKQKTDSLLNASEMEKSTISKLLYAYYFKPFEKLMQGKKTIYICPDALLNYLPVELLQNAEGKYMGELYNIVYIPSISISNVLKQRKTASMDSVIAFGNPNYSSFHPEKMATGRGYDLAMLGGIKSWANLPGTEKELQSIKAIIPSATVYQQQHISESSIKQLSSSSRLLNAGIVHFALHGLGSSVNFRDASLIVSEPDNGNQDGILQFAEIARLALNARMVCISACESGIGDISGKGNDDILNLSTAFMMAGANAVVTSSWKISDDATMLFMGEVYRNIYTNKKGISESFFIARKKFIEGGFGEKYKSPYYWAPFRYTGY